MCQKVFMCMTFCKIKYNENQIRLCMVRKNSVAMRKIPLWFQKVLVFWVPCDQTERWGFCRIHRLSRAQFAFINLGTERCTAKSSDLARTRSGKYVLGSYQTAANMLSSCKGNQNVLQNVPLVYSVNILFSKEHNVSSRDFFNIKLSKCQFEWNLQAKSRSLRRVRKRKWSKIQ